MKKIFPFICLTAIVFICLAGSPDGFSGHRGFKNPAVKKYFKEHIMPVLREKRQVLERELSTTEKNEITEYRITLKQLRQQHQDWNRGKGQESSYNEDNKQQAHKAHQQMREIMQKLEAIADKHSNTLKDIQTQLDPSRKVWEQEIAKLMPARAEDNKSNYSGHQRGFEHLSLNDHFGQTRFLLLNADANDMDGETGNELKSESVSPVAAARVDLSSFNVMPNPAINEIVTSNEALPATNQFALIDMQGKKVMTLENVQAAQHIDISQLPGGNYVIELKSGEQLVNRKIVITR